MGWFTTKVREWSSGRHGSVVVMKCWPGRQTQSLLMCWSYVNNNARALSAAAGTWSQEQIPPCCGHVGRLLSQCHPEKWEACGGEGEADLPQNQSSVPQEQQSVHWLFQSPPPGKERRKGKGIGKGKGKGKGIGIGKGKGKGKGKEFKYFHFKFSSIFWPLLDSQSGPLI